MSEGAGEVSQSRIPPSHPASWYSCHNARCPLRGSLPARPPARLHTDSPKETSHCHFNFPSAPPPTSTRPFLQRLRLHLSIFPFFFAHSLLCSLCSRTLSHHHPFLLLPATHGLFDSVCISNCVIKESRQPPRSVEMAAGAICGARLMRQRGSGWVGGWVRGWGLDSQQHPVASWGSTGCLDFHSRGFFFFADVRGGCS